MNDGSGSWPADPLDPRCPNCDGPVSATASYCMHCEADLPGAESGVAREATGSAASGSTTATGGATATGTAGPTGGTTRDWLHPAGLLDNSLTVAVGVVAGAVGGALVAAAVAWALPGGGPLLAGAVAWVLATVAVISNRTVFGAARTAGYLLALVLVALPLTISLTAPMADPGDSRLGLAVVLAIFAWPVAAVLAGVGWWLGGRDATGDDGA